MIANELGIILTRKNLTISTAESCTGGLVGSYITDVPGSSRYFLGGVITYSNEAKINILGVKRETIEKYGAVSRECAEEMVKGVTHLFNSDLGIATTGIAGPGGGSPGKPVGLVYIGIKISKDVWVKKYIFDGDRITIKQSIAKKAIEEVITKLKLLEMI